MSRRKTPRDNRGRISSQSGPRLPINTPSGGGSGTTTNVINVNTGTNVVQADTGTNVIQVGL
jgi:hypothetical protein